MGSNERILAVEVSADCLTVYVIVQEPKKADGSMVYRWSPVTGEKGTRRLDVYQTELVMAERAALLPVLGYYDESRL